MSTPVQGRDFILGLFLHSPHPHLPGICPAGISGLSLVTASTASMTSTESRESSPVSPKCLMLNTCRHRPCRAGTSAMENAKLSLNGRLHHCLCFTLAATWQPLASTLQAAATLRGTGKQRGGHLRCLAASVTGVMRKNYPSLE